MVWCRGQNLEKRVDSTGREWQFRVWVDFVNGRPVQRIFFWNKERTDSGILEFKGDQTLHIRRIRDRISKLVKDAEYRGRYRRPLRFPVERHYE
jgi:hypothetical protein